MSRSRLVRTASHFAWGRYQGFNDKHQYELALDGPVLKVDPRTGEENPVACHVNG